MKQARTIAVDGNEAAASVAYRTNEVIAIYPITPSSPMGELSDEWSVKEQPNVWGAIPEVVEMQSEGGAAGAVHGALQAGALTTTFTSSQGLLLMIPNMYKIAGELNSFCMHVAARAVSTHALSIFGDHSDVMACRPTGFAMIASGSVQEAHDMACIAQAATLKTRVPFLHFFDGFRTSHEVARIRELDNEDLLKMMDEGCVVAHRRRALNPDHPVLRGTAQNPDVFFQAREAANSFYQACPGVVREVMDQFAHVTGRRYGLFDYVGHPEAERVIVMMGSGAETAHEAVNWLVGRGEKVGLVKVRLYLPFSCEDLAATLPSSVRSVAVLDRTKEPGSLGEPLYMDVVTGLHEAGKKELLIVGGRYGLGSKEFTPAMVRAVLDNLSSASPRNHFTVGIVDDETGTSLEVDPEFDIEPDSVVRAVFYGLGADGTVGANKNSIKIISEGTDRFAQGYFVYDSKKSGALTISHLRFGPEPIQSSYLIRQAGFVACHQYGFLDRLEILKRAAPGAIFLLNSPHEPDEAWDQLPREVQEWILEKKIRLFVIDAYKVAQEAGMGGRINTVMQTCFFAISGVLPREEAITRIKKSIEDTYGLKGEEMVRRNFEAVDQSLAHLHEIRIPAEATSERSQPPMVPEMAPDFVRRVTALMMANKGNFLPVSAFPVDGTWPVGTSRWEKRNITQQIPVWDSGICIQCNKCAFVCPHAAIRAKVYPGKSLNGEPDSFLSMDYKAADMRGSKYTIQVAPEDCTGCTLCVEVCPAKDKSNPRHKALEMQPQAPLLEAERANFDYFLSLPEVNRAAVKQDVKGTQFLQPLFEYSGACAGCGETPYVKLLTQLFGDRTLMANATGCSSIYGGNLPTVPFTTNPDGRGPAWSNSLFEDNAEFGLGMRLAVDRLEAQARQLLSGLVPLLGNGLAEEILEASQEGEERLGAQRERVERLRRALADLESPEARRLELLSDYLVRKNVWIVGGDGWAYDIGYGGLDHVLASGRDVNILVLDTEVYSNTGGQASKATPMGASAKFAMAGKGNPKKDLAMLAMSYGNVYVARVAFGAKDNQTLRAFLEAESFPGPSIIIAYSPCIAHGYDLARSLDQQKVAMETGYWPLLRFDPRRRSSGENPLQLDSPHPKKDLDAFVRNEVRFRMAQKQDPERFRRLMVAAQSEVSGRFAIYEQLAKLAALRGTGRDGKTGQKPAAAAATRS
jgi:pyruvate-ferredoxin/flavodoxin oxidoreductase